MDLHHVIKQKSYERIVFVLRRHPITFIPQFLLFIVLLAVPVAVYGLITNLNPFIFENESLFVVGVLLGSAYYLFAYLLFYARFLDYYLDTWIVTNDRIVDIEQHGLFHRVTTELDLFRIQDVTTNIQGVFGTIFNFGNVQVTTASFNLHIIFKNVANPNEVREKLIHLADEDRKYHYAQGQQM